jgi:ribokinase
MTNIVVIGSANTDMVVKTDKFPLPGETKLGGTFFMNAGGKGANQAVAAARLGGNVILVAKVGNDIFGKQTLSDIKKEGINADYLFIDESSPSGVALITVNSDGENCIVVAPGANSRLLPKDIDGITGMNEAEIILMQLEIPIETIASVMKMAKGNGQNIILNPAPAQPLADELLDGLFLITPNETEAWVLTGIKIEGQTSAMQAAECLIKKGVKNVIITLGSKGAYFQSDKSHFHMQTPVVNAIDTTAAGDVFNGALAVAIAENKDWEKAVEFACEVASISVTRMGAQASIPYRNEIVL